MAKEPVEDIAASVRARLLNVAKKSGRVFDAVLLQYLQERFVYRLSLSRFRCRLILKGARLFLAYDMSLLRPTRDIDFLGCSTSNDLEEVRETFSIHTLRKAITATFARRSTRLEDRYMIFSNEFAMSREKSDQWNAFLRRSRLQSSLTVAEAIDRLKSFIEPVCSAETQDTATWIPSEWRWT